MIRRYILYVATTLAAGLLFVNVYNSLIDAPSWGTNMPASMQVARDYFKTVNPGNFFRIVSPANQVLTILALIACWKVSARARRYCALALIFAIAGDVLTFLYFYPRNEILFEASILTDLDAIKTAWSEWSSMNWFRSVLVAGNVIFDFAALTALLKSGK